MKAEISIATVVQDRAATDPERIAIKDGVQEISFGSFASAIENTAVALAGEGIGPSTKVGIEVANYYGHWVSIMAVQRLGSISASLSGLSGVEHARLAKLDVIISANKNSALKKASQKFVFMDYDWVKLATAEGSVDSLPEPDLADRSLGRFVFSSGTTGVQKGMLLPAQSLQYSVSTRAPIFDENTKHLSGGGIEGPTHRVIAVWSKGGTVISNFGLLGNNVALARTVTETTRIRTSSASLVGMMASKEGKFEGREGRRVRVGGAPLPVTLRDEALARLCGRIDIGYGSREAGTMAEGDASLLDRHPGAVGFPAEGAEIQIVDENGEEVENGEHGYVRVRTAPMVQGYIDNPKATAQFFRDGWFYPGDLGYKEADGLIVVLGRKSDVFNVGGVKFSANVVEHELRGIEGIDEVCALAVPNRSGVHVMVILATGQGDTDRAALKDEISRKLAPMEIRNFVLRWTDKIPRNERGKISRDRLAAELKNIL